MDNFSSFSFGVITKRTIDNTTLDIGTYLYAIIVSVPIAQAKKVTYSKISGIDIFLSK